MTNNPRKIKKALILADVAAGEIQQSFWELLTKVKQICPEAICGAVYIGGEYPEARETLRQSGVDVLYAAEDALLDIFRPDYHCLMLETAIRDFDPDLLLICATAEGEELAPTMGVRFRTGVAAHCVDLKIDEEGEPVCLVPAFGGKVVGEIYIPATRPRIATIKAGIFSASNQTREQKTCPTVIPIDTEVLKSRHGSIEPIGIVESAPGGRSVDKADLVVCGGYGLKDKDAFASLEKLAEYFAGAVGYTRPAVESGRPENERNLIGTSGKTVTPKVYVGFGVSGATHHVCGMKNAGTVISVNNDPNAAIFGMSDFYAVGDASKILDAMTAITEP
ncbi:MAG: electron transfer flavoprotein subunit alpha/FixB family protein [Clostridiales Family XIII bacterium]|jgi:electron transfer flavoprotein alpha subunit|nr:electron transfer flavoprotein subunit alpha/FixB family protein [Clostridiales Family XIII bacterium]